MIGILSAAAMAECDRRAREEYGIPGLVLMENAGLQTVECILESLGLPGSVLVVCGKGNNGGDGLVVARHLASAGCEVEVVLLAAAAEVEGDAATNLAIVQALGLPLTEIPDEESWEESAIDADAFDLVVDAILGTGLRSAARGVAAVAMAAIARADVPVVSVDLPSGLDADRSEPPGAAVIADLTVTFGAPRPCHVLTPAADHCGDVAVVDISIPAALLEQAAPELWLAEPEDWAAVRPDRATTAHKGDHGRVLVIGGAVGTAGAAVLAARGALRAGAGLVHVACPGAVWPTVAGHLVEALVHPAGDPATSGLGPADAPGLRARIEGCDAVALGPGIGTAGATVELVRELVRTVELPMVLDADGLNALVGATAALTESRGPRILTPHPGEAARLLGTDAESVQADRRSALAALVEASGAVVVLKGSRTLIGAPGEVPVVITGGNPGMATAGTGDVLTGAIAALLGQGLRPFDAAWAGAWIHARAGDLAALRSGEIGLTAGDLAEALPAAIGEDDGDEDQPDA